MANYIKNKDLYLELKKCRDAFLNSAKPKLRGITDPEQRRLVLNEHGNDCAGKYMTHKLATMLMLITHNYAKRGNWRGYTFVEDMIGEANLMLVKSYWKYNPQYYIDNKKAQNPMAYFTRFAQHSFVTYMNSFAKQRDIRDDLLERNGFEPSSTRQLKNEAAQLEAARLRDAESQELVVTPDFQDGPTEAELIDLASSD